MSTTALLEPPPAAHRVHPSVTPRRAAQIAGVGYVLLFVLAIFANFFVRDGLIVADDAAATAANIAESNGLFRLGLLSFLAIFLIDIVVAWAIHIVFRDTDRDVSLIAAWSRLVYTVFLGVAAIFFFQALALYSSSALSDVVEVSERNAQALILLESFNSAWLIGLAAFGLHLIILGYLIARSGSAPKLLGGFMAVAGAAYLIDTTAYALLQSYQDHATVFVAIVAIPSVIAEGWFGLWLLLRAGTNHPERPTRTTEQTVSETYQ